MKSLRKRLPVLFTVMLLPVLLDQAHASVYQVIDDRQGVRIIH